MEYKCTICIKNYKSYKSLWNHNKQFHTNVDIIENNHQNTFIDENIIKNDDNTLNKNIIKCDICNKVFSFYQNKWRHAKKCKETLNSKLLEENKFLKESVKSLTNEVKELKTLKNDFEELKKQLSASMNSNCKVHPKTLTKINKQLIDKQINNNQININDNKVINNNTINLITLGKEDLSNVLSKKEKINILNERCMSLEHFIRYIHFNENYPQFQNILITNINNTIGYKYDEYEKQFIAIDKDELLNEIITERVSDINYFYEDYEDELDVKTKKLIEQFLDKIDDDKYRETKRKNIKLIIYNNRNKVSKEITQNLQVIV